MFQRTVSKMHVNGDRFSYFKPTRARLATHFTVLIINGLPLISRAPTGYQCNKS